ncbi:MAG TPA: Mu transposase C-terminal domain-containing protein, partial [Pirellulaceae bacterium]|nr:Mu transposase C-terminal domain-containing protein [Pirellulaceae bacterium]
ALLALPRERFACFHEARRKVSRDGHVEVAKAYYSAPPEYLGREVWVRWDMRLVRIFNHRFEQIALHVRHEQGRFSTHAEHIAREKISGLERGASYLLGKIELIGLHTHQWAQAMLHARGIEGTRVLQGLLALTKKHGSQSLENACEIALSHSCWRLRSIRQLLKRHTARQEPLPFLDEHPIIRPLEDYAAVVAQALHRQTDRPSVGEGFGRHDWTMISPESGHEKSPAGSVPQGSSVRSPPRPGYPLPGCTSAEPGSVSPDDPTVVPSFSPDQEPPHE